MRAATASFLIALLCPALALAWGPQGHRIVAKIAQDGLNARAQAAVAGLLAGERNPTLAGVANWADDLRYRDPDLFRRTSHWHYVDFRGGDCNYQPSRDCPNGDCVIAATEQQLRALGDIRQPRQARVQALKFVVHFIGDMHQPLHASNHDDRGGNDYQIHVYGRGTNLHHVWDGLIIGRDGFDASTEATRLEQTPIARKQLRIDANAPQRWAEQSCRLIDADELYPPSHRIEHDYLDSHRPLAERQLHLAGARLAAELNAVLGGERTR